jgi:molecular chaperone HscA
VTAREETSGVQASIQVKPSYGLSDTEVETMLRDSMTHAHDDMEARRLREQQVEADRVIEALGAALAADAELFLDADERARIEAAAAELEKVRRAEDHRAIKRAIEAVEKASADYVARRMDANIRRAMAGHAVDDFK